MPWVYEDEMEDNDPMYDDRHCRHSGIDDVLHADRQRFYKVCRKHGYDCTTIRNEARRKHPDF